MPRRPAHVTQADIARALRAVKAAGVDARIEVRPDGTIVILTGPQSEISTGAGKLRFEPKRELVL